MALKPIPQQDRAETWQKLASTSNGVAAPVAPARQPLQQEQVVTFLYVRLSETQDAGRSPADLGAYDQVIEEVCRAHGGIPRRIAPGTALLLFPARVPAESPSRPGIEAAVALRRELEAVNGRRREEEERPFRIGIGVHTAPLLPDELDRQHRLAALHRSIQDAEGLSLLNRQAPFPTIFVSKNALQGLGSANGYRIENLGEAFAPNQEKALTVYALM